MPSDRNICEWVLDRVDPYLDGELSPDETARVEAHAASCRDCEQEIALAHAVVSELRALPEHRAPEWITARAEATAHGAAMSSPSLRERARAWLGPRIDVLMRPAMAAMLVVIAAVTVFVVTQRGRVPTEQNGYTQAEIEAAAREAQIAFAYVGKYTARAGTLLREDVMAERVMPQFRRAMNETREQVVVGHLIPTIQQVMLEALFVETESDSIPSNQTEGRPK